MHSSSLPMVSPCYRRCICGTPMLLDVDGVSMLLIVGTQHWSKLPPSQHGSLGLQAHSTGYSYHRHSTGPSYHRHSMAIKLPPSKHGNQAIHANAVACVRYQLLYGLFFPLFSPFPFFPNNINYNIAPPRLQLQVSQLVSTTKNKKVCRPLPLHLTWQS